MAAELWLIRHGETEWSLSGAHTGSTDIPLTANGMDQAKQIAAYLDGRRFDAVFTSPLQRASETCRIAGFGGIAQTDGNLREWNYGVFEGRTTKEIQQEYPGWSIWTSTIPNGESLAEVGVRAQAAIDRALATGSKVALFSHGHLSRILAAVWLKMLPSAGQHFALDTAGISILGYEREARVIRLWNRTPD